MAPGHASLHVEREALDFAAAHFSIIGGERETLHGHNYRVRLVAEGAVRADGTVVDFAALKGAIRDEVARLDHRMLLPTESPVVAVDAATTPGRVEVRIGDAEFRFPARDVALLPIPNTTCECIAGLLLTRLRERLGGLDARLEVRVDESPGQGASVAEAAR